MPDAAIAAALNREFASIQEAFVLAVPPPLAKMVAEIGVFQPDISDEEFVRRLLHLPLILPLLLHPLLLLCLPLLLALVLLLRPLLLLLRPGLRCGLLFLLSALLLFLLGLRLAFASLFRLPLLFALVLLFRITLLVDLLCVSRRCSAKKQEQR